MDKKFLFEMLELEYESNKWKNFQKDEFEFHNYIIEKVAPHLTTEGIKELYKYYRKRNEEGKR
jgi:hypothetical protein